MTDAPDLFADLFEVIPQFPARHATSDPLWRLWRAVSIPHVAEVFKDAGDTPVPFGPFGGIAMPYFQMGNINSLDLFGLDELILFSFYHRNRDRYKRVADMGTNIGLHTIVMGRCGFDVRSFEPDPVHVERLNANLALNNVTTDLRQAAVSLEDGQTQFIRVKGNTTGSHIAGAKPNPYGELDTFDVEITAAAPHLEWADLAKIDIEGHEAALISGLDADIWTGTDAVLEIGTEENARVIFDHLIGSKTNIFAQKIGWQKVTRFEDMPYSHRDGSAFLSGKDAMPW